MKLNALKVVEGSTKNKKRVGRGIGSGKGKTCGRGVKGQKSRSGVAIKAFEGGQQPIYRRLPKRGFNSLSKSVFQTVNLSAVADFIERGKLDAKEAVTAASLYEAGVIRSKEVPVKLLAKGELSVKADFIVDACSDSAKQKVEKAGGSIKLTA